MEATILNQAAYGNGGSQWIWFNNLRLAWVRIALWTFIISLGIVCADLPEGAREAMLKRCEVGTWRRTVVTVAIFLVILTLLPVTDELAAELGIGLVTTF